MCQSGHPFNIFIVIRSVLNITTTNRADVQKVKDQNSSSYIKQTGEDIYSHSQTFSHTPRNWSVLITCKWYWLSHPFVCLYWSVCVRLLSCSSAPAASRGSILLLLPDGLRCSTRSPTTPVQHHHSITEPSAASKMWTLSEYSDGL